MWRYVNYAEVYEVKRFEENGNRLFYPYYLGCVTGACPIEGGSGKAEGFGAWGRLPPYLLF